MFEIKCIQEDANIYKVSQMAAESFKDEKQSMKLAITLEYEAIKRSLEREKSVLIGAFMQGDCVGFIWAKFDDKDKEVKIYNLLVIESHRKKGIAKKLKQEVEMWAQQMGAYTIVSTVHAHNKNMIHINESMDYEVEKIIMRKKLF
ncbi:GNAT family N-acetyltransferase [Mammaliicoccus vitulinus]|uniref:GNAT family N-acetyltransferase n=1 Tax=Mammaliicoccus vitulinus TaxID=71237 RepID=UPI003B9DEBD6